MITTVTNSGLPAIWESGGGLTKTGQATIVAGPNGEKMKPTYIKRSGNLACAEHALFIARKGFLVIKVDRFGGDETITIQRIESARVVNGQTELTLSLVNEYKNGTWQSPFDVGVENPLAWATEAALQKSYDYHCREPFYIQG